MLARERNPCKIENVQKVREPHHKNFRWEFQDDVEEKVIETKTVLMIGL